MKKSWFFIESQIKKFLSTTRRLGGILVFSAAFGSTSAKACALKIIATPVKDSKGQFLVTLCPSEKCHQAMVDQKESPDAIQFPVPIPSSSPLGSLTIEVPNSLPQGYYSVFLAHDEDSNGEINFNGLVPSEPFGISNLKRYPLFGSPDFDASKVYVSNDVQVNTVTVKML